MKLIIRNKNDQRLRRAAKTRSKIADSGNHRISIHRSIQHMYLQLITPQMYPWVKIYLGKWQMYDKKYVIQPGSC